MHKRKEGKTGSGRHIFGLPGQKFFVNDMAGYIAHEFNDCMEELIEGREEDVTFMDDVTELQELIDTFLAEERYSIA